MLLKLHLFMPSEFKLFGYVCKQLQILENGLFRRESLPETQILGWKKSKNVNFKEWINRLSHELSAAIEDFI